MERRAVCVLCVECVEMKKPLAECAVMVVVMTIAKDDASHHFPTPYEREA